MSFLVPGYLIAAGGFAAGIVLLHFIVTREPTVYRLPTARFAPEREIVERARAIEPRHLLLLLLRVGAVLAAGAALARPVFPPGRAPLTRMILLDRSRAVADPREAADSARRLLRPGDVVIGFDSAAAEIPNPTDSLAVWSRSAARGRLSTALITALRAGSRLRDGADSLDLVLVSPMAREAVDAATDSVRSRWPAAITIIRVRSRPDTLRRTLSFRGGADDPLRYALSPGVASPGGQPVVLVRGTPTPADSEVTRSPGGVLVVWPDPPALPGGWRARSPDTVGAVAAGGTVVVAPFLRAAEYSESGSERVVARWVDGAPAAVEEPVNAGCIRAVAIPVPRIGDLVLEPRFQRLLAELIAPCGGAVDWSAIDAARLARLAGASRPSRALAAGLAPVERVPSPWSRWLLVAALVLLGGEWLVRRRLSR